jgi:hypothetical protein
MLKTSRSAMRLISRSSTAITLTVSLAAACSLAAPTAASASKRQLAMFQDGTALQADVPGTLAKFRQLGATTVRVVLFWYSVAPSPTASKVPAGFNGSDPNAYPSAGWAPYDQIVKDAKQDGMTIDFTVAGGAPTWADGSGIPAKGKDPHFAWKPNPKLYGQFVHAVGERYDGSFTPSGSSSPLPAVHFWAIWNEPNFGQDLGPQAIDGSTVSVAPMMYRALVSAGWNSLQQTGHGHDTILIGEFAARGANGKVTRSHPQGLPGNFGQTKPLQFIRTLYCVDSNDKQLSGKTAKNEGCPTNKAGYRSFRKQNPGLFNASGVGDHPYPGGGSPISDGASDPDFATFPGLGNLEKLLDKLNGMYGSHKKYSIYNDEYAYITRPPQHAPYVSPATAAYYINWAEYLSWKSPRIASYMQYLLDDPASSAGVYSGFASGLYTSKGKPKATLNAYRMPVYMPKTTFSRSQAVELWGEARPAHFMNLDSHQGQTVAIQLQAGGHGAFHTVKTVNGNGYFDLHMAFKSSGNVRLEFTYSAHDPFLPVGVAGTTIDSRSVAIKVH